MKTTAYSDTRLSAVRWAVLPLFLVSGATALVYEVTWTRACGVVFGNTIFAVSTVLTAFMLGLAAGSWLLGKQADKSRNPLIMYAVLEFLIAGYAFAFPSILRATDLLYVWFFRSYEPGFYTLSLLRFAVSVLILFLPTVLMGGTLPVLCRLWAAGPAKDDAAPQVAGSVGLLYGVNTFGAVAGSFLAGYFLIRLFGVGATIRLAAGANLAIAVAAFILSLLIHSKKSRRAKSIHLQDQSAESPVGAGGEAAVPADAPGRSKVFVVLAAIGLSGFCALALEVLWARVLVFVLGTSTYAFACMLTCFILGIAIGSTLCSAFLVERLKKPIYALGIIQLLIAISVLASIPLLGLLWHIDFVLVTRLVGTRTSFVGEVVTHFLDTSVIVLIPTILMGMVFPVAVRICTRDRQSVAAQVGRVYACNTVGCVLGSFAAGFVMIPLMGLRDSFIVVMAAQFLPATVLIAISEKGRRALAGVAAVLSTAAVVGAVIMVPADVFVRTMNTYHYPSKIVYINDDATGTVTVHDVPDGDRLIAVDGVDVAGIDLMLRTTQKLQAYAPLIIHENPRNVLQIGYGSGETCGIGLAFGRDGYKYSIAEICPAVFEAGKFFDEINRSSYKNPNLRKIIMDGKNFVKLTDEKFDVIMNDSTYPGTTGSSALYTYDHFVQCRERLKPGGVLSCWVPLDLRPEDFNVIVRSFQAAMPNCSLWMVNNCLNKHAVLLATLSPTQIDFERVKKLVERPDIAADLAEINIHSVYDFLDCFVVDQNGLSAIAGDPKVSGLNTDDMPRLEFGASIKRDIEECWLAVLRAVSGNHSPVAAYVVNTGAAPEQSQLIRTTLDQYFQGTAYAIQGLVGLLEGDPEIVKSAFELARKANPLDRDIDSCLNEMRDEIKALEEALKRAPDATDIISRLAKRYMLSADYPRAIEQYEKYLQINPNNAPAWNNLAVCCKNSEQFDKAKQAFEAAIRSDSRFVEAYLNLAALHEKLGDIKSSIEVLEKAVPVSPDHRKIYVYWFLSRAYYRQKQYKSAVDYINEALLLAPPDSDLRKVIQSQKQRIIQAIEALPKQ